ncbi:Tetratricopeptide TPR_1 repeat-containing protein [[Leptolyngbya] sp. PCC 7376]|uniref:tetratricopeptide repeat protein n=1 Tax=[Leptolyngbya] sp. PCC 7376 TaxID=111781 RepID=UPI00029F1C69|nr:tetratricopeptide repeat protein [[Leptolyngbya] sp. PCC 7376]AFY40669.1 Tetratricopeptide TPR_1 repeat-containing protein [[Leptolyngbya] sp. PCC 7376]
MSISSLSIFKNKSVTRNTLLGFALLGLLPAIWVTAPILRTKLTPAAQAYPYQFSPSERTQESLTAEIATLHARIRRNPQDGLDLASLAGAYLKLARITGEDRWYQMAEMSAQQSLENLPFSNNGALVALAKVAEARHDFAEATRLAEQASGGEAIAIIVTAHLATGKIIEANTMADKLVAFSPSMASLTLRALARQAEGDLTGAQLDFEQAIAVEQPSEARGSALARTLLGKLYADQGQYQSAESLYQEALAIVPDYPQALLNLGELEYKQENYRAAQKFYEQVSDPLALLALAKVKRAQGQEEAARIQWAEAEIILRDKVKANPLDHGRELAELLLERGDDMDRLEAIALMEAEVKHRRNAETLNTFAWSLAEAGRWQEADAIIGEAIAQGIQNAEIFDRAGRLAQALGETTQAESYFRQADNLKPE